MNPLFSIIIPTHNRVKLLQKAVQSVQNQKTDSWEIIIIDDGSTDNTKDIVNAISDHRIHYFYQEHKERSAARNVGIENAKGKYICFLDDDDYFLPNHLEVIEKEIKQHHNPIGIFRTGMITKSSLKEVYSPFYDSKNSKHPIHFFLINMVGIHTLCYHREILEVHQYDERWFHFQDTHLLVLCLLKFPFFQINEHTAVYVRYDQMGSLNIFKSDYAKARTENNVDAIKDLFKQGGSELLKYVPSNMATYMVAAKYLSHAQGALHIGRRKLAKTYFYKSLKEGKGRFLLLQYIKFSLRYLLSYLK